MLPGMTTSPASRHCSNSSSINSGTFVLVGDFSVSRTSHRYLGWSRICTSIHTNIPAWGRSALAYPVLATSSSKCSRKTSRRRWYSRRRLRVHLSKPSSCHPEEDNISLTNIWPNPCGCCVEQSFRVTRCSWKNWLLVIQPSRIPGIMILLKLYYVVLIRGCS